MSNKPNNNQRHQSPRDPEPPAAKNTPATKTEEKRQQTEIRDLEDRVTSTERGMLRWTRMVGLFTFISAAAACFSVYSFVRSERAYLVIRSGDDISFAEGEPSAKPGGADLVIKIQNTGKHLGEITEFSIVPFVGNNRNLPEIPNYSQSYKVPVPPTVPGSDTTVVFGIQDNPALGSLEPIYRGIADGSIPLWVYGRVFYDIGFPSLSYGELGFCARYVAASQRRRQRAFVPCENPRYTYVR